MKDSIINTSIQNNDTTDVNTKNKHLFPTNDNEERNFITSTVTNEKLNEISAVQCEAEENSKSVFIADSEICDTEKESSLETEIVYAKEGVQFLDVLGFDDDELCEYTLDYIDSSI